MPKLKLNGHYPGTVTPRGKQRRSFFRAGLPHIMLWANRAGPECLRPVHRVVLQCLAAHANEKGLSWPSQETIAEYAGLKSTAAARSALQDLAAIGMITIDIRDLQDDGDQPHQYEYRLDGHDCEWLPFDYGDSDGDITLAALVARQRDQLQVANYHLQVENEQLRERLSNYEEPPLKGSSSNGSVGF